MCDFVKVTVGCLTQHLHIAVTQRYLHAEHSIYGQEEGPVWMIDTAVKLNLGTAQALAYLLRDPATHICSVSPAEC